MSQASEQINVVEIQLRAWREQMLDRLLPWAAGIGTVALVLGLYAVISAGRWAYVPIYVAVYMLLLVMTFSSRMVYPVKARVTLGLLAVLGVAVLSETGLAGVGRPFLLALPIAALLLLTWRMSLLMVAFGSAMLLLFGALTGNWLDWALAAAVLAMLGMAIVTGLRYLLQSLVATLQNEMQTRRQLDEMTLYLEEKVSRQEQLTEQRTAQIELGGRLEEELDSAGRSLGSLTSVARLLQRELDLEQVNIYILEANGQVARLQATTTRVGGLAPVPGNQVRADDFSVLGRALAHGQAGEDRSGEMARQALPLLAGQQRLGALEVVRPLDDRGPAWSGELLEYLAGQLALAVDSMVLRQEMEHLQDERQHQVQAVEFDLPADVRFVEYHRPDREGWARGDLEGLAAEERSNLASIPLLLRGREIGQLAVERPAGSAGWSAADLDTLRAVAHQMVLSLESTRLMDEGRQRAAREQLLGQVAAQMRETLDIDTALQTAVREIGAALNLAEVEVRISSDLGAISLDA